MHSVQNPLLLVDTGVGELIRALALGSTLVLVALVGASATAASPTQTDTGAASCDTVFDPDAEYPLLPDLGGADVSGEAGVLVHLQAHRGVVEIGECLYELDRPLEIDFAGLSFVSILLEVHAETTGSALFVSSASGVEAYTLAEPFAVFGMGSEEKLGFELTLPGQSAPTVPVVVAKPVDDGPPPR